MTEKSRRWIEDEDRETQRRDRRGVRRFKVTPAHEQAQANARLRVPTFTIGNAREQREG